MAATKTSATSTATIQSIVLIPIDSGSAGVWRK
jgi:hypothetical protein